MILIKTASKKCLCQIWLHHNRRGKVQKSPKSRSNHINDRGKHYVRCVYVSLVSIVKYYCYDVR